MNPTVLLCFIVVIASAICVQAAPAEGLNELQDPVAPAHGERQRRVTCDLMSVSTPIGSLNHAACAAHCLSMGGGRRGGSCSNGVCVCRF
ncbi:defensin-like isoform X3 [Chrysoperla carnea]|uniref:defensin-like isoform X3 n=1 Tax=Chrysoperla carnea TaxID=189513 RepID=UPI001D07F71D|nr:defensin-like isoform X3 [Chrysoperla carnea]